MTAVEDGTRLLAAVVSVAADDDVDASSVEATAGPSSDDPSLTLNTDSVEDGNETSDGGGEEPMTGRTASTESGEEAGSSAADSAETCVSVMFSCT